MFEAHSSIRIPYSTRVFFFKYCLLRLAKESHHNAHLFIYYLTIFYLSSGKNIKSRYLQEELKRKSSFVEEKPLLSRANSRQKKEGKRIKINPSG